MSKPPKRKKTKSSKKKLFMKKYQPPQNINELPFEIIIEIFRYLPFHDRRTSRLVCKRWCKVSNLDQFSVKEKLFINSFYKANVIFDELLTLKNNHYNLEFDGRCFTYQSYYFWCYFGKNIVTLHLNECELGEDVFERIADECTNLSSFVWQHSQVAHSAWLNSSSLEKTIAKNQRLHFFEVDVPDNWVTVHLLIQIFIIFPAIKRFTIYIRDENIELLFIHLSQLKQFKPNLFNKLDLKFQCRRMVLSSPFSNVKTVLNMVNVTEIQIQYQEYHQENVKLILKTLQKIVWKDVYSSFVHFVSNLKNHCPELRNLEVYGNYCAAHCGNAEQIQSLFKSLLNSSLQQLSLNNFTQLFPLGLLWNSSFTKNKSIHSLRVSNCFNDERRVAPLLKFLSNLKHLYLNPITSSSFLQYLGNVQPDLLSLIITLGQKYVNNDSIRPIQKKFKSLLYLHISLNDSSTLDVLYSVLRSINLSKLRYFRLEYPQHNNFLFEKTLPGDVIDRLRGQLPELESLSITVSGTYEQWESCIRTMKKLRFLRIYTITNGRTLNNNQCIRLFYECPTLRFLNFQECKTVQTYYYDFMSKSVMTEKYCARYFVMTAQKLSTLGEHWAARPRNIL